MAATARPNADSLKRELDQLKKKLKEEEKEKAEAQAQRKEREDLLHKSTLALLGTFYCFILESLLVNFIKFQFSLLISAEATDIPSNSVGKLPDGSSANAISLVIEFSDLVQALLQKNKAVMSRLHAMILPKADQEKTLGQLTDTFFINTEGTIDVLNRTSRTYDALLAFQLLMGHGFKAEMELLTKELPKD
jgi:hypothetical protein